MGPMAAPTLRLSHLCARVPSFSFVLGTLPGATTGVLALGGQLSRACLLEEMLPSFGSQSSEFDERIGAFGRLPLWACVFT